MYKENAENPFTILSWLIATTSLKAVHNYDVKTSDVFPYATITVADGENDFYDTSENQMSSTYSIIIFNENKNIMLSESVMRELVDSILVELNKKTNLQLSWTVNFIRVPTINWGWSTTNESMRICELIVEVNENLAT